jgi:hypothetical protein
LIFIRVTSGFPAGIPHSRDLLGPRRPGAFLKMDSDDHMEAIKRSIVGKLFLHFAELNHPLGKLHSQPHRAETDIDRFDRVLALWIDLQRVVLARTELANGHDRCSPWNCPDAGVRDAWQSLTHPRNALALENLFYQLPEGPQLELARKALQFCRERCNSAK